MRTLAVHPYSLNSLLIPNKPSQAMHKNPPDLVPYHLLAVTVLAGHKYLADMLAFKRIT